MTTITYPGGPVMPVLKALTSSYATKAQSGVVVHPTLDGDPVFTLRPADGDTGVLELLVADEATAADVYTAHKLATILTIADPTLSLLNFRYVLADDVERTLDPDTLRRWIVTVPYRVVS